MKKILLLCALWASFCSIITAQHIPDVDFANAIRWQCYTCIDSNNNLLPPAANQKSLKVESAYISSLEGISGFTNLDTLICNNNLLINFPVLPSGLKYLDCNYNNIRYLDTLPDSLIYLSCNYNNLSGLDSLPNTLRYLSCTNNTINYLENLPNNLSYLNCASNGLNGLLNLPNDLDSLICPYNNLHFFPNLPPNLTYLNCAYNHLSAFPNLPPSLLHFNCSVNPLSTVSIVLPSNLLSFECYSCNLNNLPAVLPVNLTRLNCYDNSLTNLPATLPNSLIEFDCGVNLLTNLPASLPPNLTSLSCQFNQLTTLPALPPNLSVLKCQFNQLTTLPNLPNSLSVLMCSNNQITVLPALPSGIYDLDCGTNYLMELPTLPYQLNYLACNNNVNLNCLPLLPGNLQSLFCDNTNITCIPNLTNWMRTHNLPICNGSNNNNCSYSIAGGRVYYDADNDGIYNANNGDTALTNKMVFSYNYVGICDSNGFYQIVLDSNAVNEFGVDWLYWYDSTYFIATPEYYSITTTNNRQTFLNNDFRLYKTQPLTDVAVGRALSVIPDRYRVGFNSIFWIEYGNVGNMVADGTISITLDNRVSFVEASQSVTQNGQVITFNYSDLQLFEQRYFAVRVYTPASIPLGDTIRHLTTITSVNPDNNLNGNVFENVGITVGAYDPNNILASDTTLCLDDFSAAHDFIHYKINFQNTGTDYAQNVIVTDTLSDLLDIASFRPLSASHNYTLKIENYSKNGVDKKVLKWIFNDIFLVDSFANEPLSHGFISYKVRPKTNPQLNYNDIINSQTHIYFDFNPAVNTNINQINTDNCKEGSLTKNDFLILPNPNRGSFWVQINLKIAADCKCIIYNNLGQIVYQQNISTNLPEFNLSHLQAGVYNLQIINEHSTATKSFVISR